VDMKFSHTVCCARSLTTTAPQSVAVIWLVRCAAGEVSKETSQRESQRGCCQLWWRGLSVCLSVCDTVTAPLKRSLLSLLLPQLDCRGGTWQCNNKALCHSKCWFMAWHHHMSVKLNLTSACFYTRFGWSVDHPMPCHMLPHGQSN